MRVTSDSALRLIRVLALVASMGPVLVSAGGSVSATAQTTGPAPVRLLIDSMAGPDLFRAYCAACHGADGRGQGPAAQSLKTPPSDLTGLTRRSAGTFPRAHVQSVLNGESSVGVGGAHGSATMPVWGPIFRALEAGPQADVRIANLVRHLESLQR